VCRKIDLDRRFRVGLMASDLRWGPQAVTSEKPDLDLFSSFEKKISM
jgi:hypothetical protein